MIPMLGGRQQINDSLEDSFEADRVLSINEPGAYRVHVYERYDYSRTHSVIKCEG